MRREAVLQKEKLPALDSQARFGWIYKVLMVGVNDHRKTEQHGAVFAQHLHNRKKLELH